MRSLTEKQNPSKNKQLEITELKNRETEEFNRVFQKWTRSQTKELVTWMRGHLKLSSQRNKKKRMAKNEKSLWDTKKRKKKLHYGNPEEKE